jgi:rubredoxin
MRYILLAFVIAGFVGLSLALYLYSIAGTLLSISLALLVTYFLGKKLVELVDKKVKVTCPMCNAPALEENHRLQCQLPEYECKHCNSVYRDGVLMEKESP